MRDQDPAASENGLAPPVNASDFPNFQYQTGNTAPRRIEEIAADFEDFYREFTPILVAFLMAQGASQSLAADVAQETMLKAWRRWTAIEHPRAWTRTAASRTLIKYLVEDSEVPADWIPTTALIQEPDPGMERDLIRLLRRLPPRQRQVMAWTLAEHTPTEIATELGITPEAVRNSIMEARRKLNVWRREGAQDHDFQ